MPDSDLDIDGVQHLFYHLAIASRKIAQQKHPLHPTHRAATVLTIASRHSRMCHFSWCFHAKAIAKKNKITFSSVDAAKKAGYKLHECSSVFESAKTRRQRKAKVAQMAKHYKQMMRRITTLEKRLVGKIPADRAEHKKLDTLRVRLEINKAKIKRLLDSL